MKIRLGFVSNSSSSSFCITGIYRDNWDDDLDEKAQEIGLYTSCGEYDGMYIGLQFEGMGLDETRRQFEARAKELLVKIGIDEDPSYYCEGWYDG